MARAIIRFTLVTKRGRKVISTQPVWLASASFADGPGLRVTRMTTTRHRDAAATFSLEHAHAIAVQFSHLKAAMETPDGAPLATESLALRDAQLARRAEARQAVSELNEALREMIPQSLLDQLKR